MNKIITKTTKYTLIAAFVYLLTGTPNAFAHPDNMVYPVIGNTNYSDTFWASRPNGTHHAIDIFGAKHLRLVSSVDGYVSYVGYPQPSYGWYVEITDADGFRYNYIHINNDTPGTDDGSGTAMDAYGPYVKQGNVVKKGQLIGYLGDSGNAETTPPHLHFEIVKPGYSWPVPQEGYVNPFTYLNRSVRVDRPTPVPVQEEEIVPYGLDINSDISVATGNFDADEELETVTGAGYGGGPHVRLFDDDLSALPNEFMAFNPRFYGGVDVTTGDVNGDNVDEVIVAAGKGGGPHVRILTKTGAELGGFYAYSPLFTGGVRVAAGDVDNDGVDEIVTGVLGQGGPHVKVFEMSGQVIAEYMAYPHNFYGGVDVAVGNVDSSTPGDEVVTAAGPSAGSHVRVFQGNAFKPLGGFVTYNSDSGVKVSVSKKRNSTEQAILTVPWRMGFPYAREYDKTGKLLREKFFFEEWWKGSYDIAGSDVSAKGATGVNRRAAVSEVLEVR